MLLAVLFLLGSRSTYAVPVIDGIFTAGEWDGFIAQGFDPNEALIPDSYDLSNMRVILENTGGASDGLYVLLQTYAAPSLVDTGIGPPPALVSFLLDANGIIIQKGHVLRGPGLEQELSKLIKEDKLKERKKN